MSAATVGLALVLPTVAGYGLWRLLAGRPNDAFSRSAAWGAGYFVGAVGWGAMLSLARGRSTMTLFSDLVPWLFVLAALMLASAWRWAPSRPTVDDRRSSPSRSERVALAALLVLLLATGCVITMQAAALPTLTWDAWNAWLAKSKAWYFAGELVPAVSFEIWRDQAVGEAVTTTAWFYPEALPRFALWLASAAGEWNEAAVHLAWPLAWLALGLACFGYLGLLGLSRLPALAAATFVLTLPLITAHASLAGYMDLWLALGVGLAGMQWLYWYRTRRWRDALLCALFAVLLPLVKLEGAIWLACLAGATVLAVLPCKWRWTLVLAAPATWALGLAMGGLRVPLPGLGVVRFGSDVIDVPMLGSMRLAWRPVLDELAQALLLLPNWSLLWYVAPLVLVLRWRALLASPMLSAFGGFLALGYGFLFLLFFLTDAAVWAQNHSSSNRLVMHLVPATVVWLSLLWVRPARPDTARSIPD